MPRRNTASRGQRKCTLPIGFHLMYSTEEFGDDAVVVRYLGESNGDYLTVWHPEGYELQAHVSHCWRPTKVKVAA